MDRAQSRDHIHASNTFGHVAADRIASGMGSWTFIIAQTVIIIIWIALNLIGIINHWDPYPFILLNLLFSTQAAYSAPIIMMSQNRQAQKDHLRDDHEAKEVNFLFQINQQQLEILHILRKKDAPDSQMSHQTEETIKALAKELQEEAEEIDALNHDDATSRNA